MQIKKKVTLDQNTKKWVDSLTTNQKWKLQCKKYNQIVGNESKNDSVLSEGQHKTVIKAKSRGTKPISKQLK
jgi:hypothetical protein